MKKEEPQNPERNLMSLVSMLSSSSIPSFSFSFSVQKKIENEAEASAGCGGCGGLRLCGLLRFDYVLIRYLSFFLGVRGCVRVWFFVKNGPEKFESE